jgi:hypothetical protein
MVGSGFPVRIMLTLLWHVADSQKPPSHIRARLSELCLELDRLGEDQDEPDEPYRW